MNSINDIAQLVSESGDILITSLCFSSTPQPHIRKCFPLTMHLIQMIIAFAAHGNCKPLVMLPNTMQPEIASVNRGNNLPAENAPIPNPEITKKPLKFSQDAANAKAGEKLMGSLVFYTDCNYLSPDSFDTKVTMDLVPNLNQTVPKSSIYKALEWNYPLPNTTLTFYNPEGTEYAVIRTPDSGPYQIRFCWFESTNALTDGLVKVRSALLHSDALFPMPGAYFRVEKD